MPSTRLTRLELQIMEILWTNGPSAVREVVELFPQEGRPAYTTVQTVVYRLESKKAVRRTKKIGNAFVFEAAIDRSQAQHRLVDEFLGLFGGRTQPMMAHLVDTGRLTLDDIREAERLIREAEDKARNS